MNTKRTVFKTGEWASVAGIAGFLDSLAVAYWAAIIAPKIPWAPLLPPGLVSATLAGAWGFAKNAWRRHGSR